MDEAPQDVITAVWQPYVISEEGHIHLRYYTFCVLLQLRDALRRRSIFAAGSERWGDLRHKLLSETTWHKVKTQVCRSLGHSTTPETVMETLEKQLDAAYQQVAANLPENTKARLETVADKTRFILEPLEGLEEPASLVALRDDDMLRATGSLQMGAVKATVSFPTSSKVWEQYTLSLRQVYLSHCS